jgi:CheY-like chemotaxis protein/anti-sigma regulatory factor (Ser/Thr protein kinase)
MMPTVLVVDDSRMDQRLVGALLKDTPKLTVEFAGDGVEALQHIRVNPPDLVITDYLMPQMDGLELLLKLGREHPLIPVILMTGYGSEEVAFKAACSGARAYVPKTSLAKLLPGMVQQLLTLCKEKRELNRFLQSITGSESTFVIKDNDTSVIAHLLEYSTACMRNAKVCDEGGEELVCLALEEALRNAVHHGNLELSSKLREEYDDDKYTELFERRRRTPPYCDRKVYVKVQISAEGATFVIRDEGPGFDPGAVPDPTAPENIEAVCGRGIWLMRSLMTEVSYNKRGNEVTLIKRPTPKQAEGS